jgi:replicative DNA helicase Mcm
LATLASGKLSERFEDFLKSVTDRSGNYVYRTKVSQLISNEGKSLSVDFGDLLKYDSDLANRLLLEPDSSLASFRIAAFETMRSENALYADRVKRELTVRIRAIPDLVPLRRVDTSYLDRMLAVSGMVVRTSELRPLMTSAAWVCPSGHVTYQDQDDLPLKKPPKCETCGEERNFELDRKHSRFIDFQILRVQESPEELPPGQLPQFFDVNVEGDIVNMARPGDRAVLTGVVRAVPDYALGQVKTRLFKSQIDCNHVEVKGKEPEQLQITKEDEKLIKDLAAEPDAYDRLIASVAPVILGHLPEKESILLLLAGGSSTPLPDGTKLRGDINVLFVGDPGVAKSEMLKFAAQVAPRGIFASGRGTTSAGLSAAVIREKNVLMLEAGVVVLADQGIACITEDTEVYTGQRLVKIGKVWEDASGPTFMTKSGREAKKIFMPVNIYDRNQRADLVGPAYAIMRKRHMGEVVKLTFASGLSLKVTPEHLLKRPTDVKNLWVRADAIRAGDELRSPVRVFGPAAYLAMTPEETYSVGCVYGDGWRAPSSVTISQSKTNEDIVSEIVRRMPGTFALYDKGERVRTLGKYQLVSRMFQLYTSDRDFLRKTQLLLRSPSIDNVLMLGERALWAFLAGIFDTDGDLNHANGKVVAARIHPTSDEHELSILLYALRRLGVYARIHGKRSSIPTIQMTGADITRFLRGIADFSVKLRREPEEVVIYHKGKHSLERGREKVVSVERVPYDGYVYDFSVGKYHNYESAMVYVHNCIDEFDKMKPEDRTALHESMEQQTITIAKGGIYASLNARTAILAACNPVLGRYNPFQNLTENISTLPIPLLTRFDLIFVIKDTPQPADDERLASHILAVHERRTYATPPPVEFSLLKKYIAYAKKISPSLTKEAIARLKDYYLELRKGGGEEGQIPPTPRTLESLIRVATARARILLREEVSEEDALAAIALMNRMVEDVLTDATTKKTDFGIQLGKPVGETKNLRAAMEIFKSLEGAEKKPVERRAFKEELVKSKFTDEDAEKMIRTMFREGLVYESKPGYIRRLGG